jgi:hypothetical protein
VRLKALSNRAELLGFSHAIWITNNGRSRFIVRDSWLRKLQHRRQVAHDGRVERNSVGIFAKRRSPRRRCARAVQTRSREPNQNRDAVRHLGLSAENFRRPSDAARAERLEVGVYENKGNAALIFGLVTSLLVRTISFFRAAASCLSSQSSRVLLFGLQRLRSFVDRLPRISRRLLAYDEGPARGRALSRRSDRAAME